MAGGAPYKFVSGCFAEGKIAAETSVREILAEQAGLVKIPDDVVARERSRTLDPLAHPGPVSPEEMEERLQKVMDEYAGGIRTQYAMNESSLLVAERKVKVMRSEASLLGATDLHGLMNLHEVVDRIDVARVLISHLLARRETRWPGFQTRLDFPQTREEWRLFVNSVSEPATGQIRIVLRPLDSFTETAELPEEVGVGHSH